MYNLWFLEISIYDNDLYKQYNFIKYILLFLLFVIDIT